MRPGPRRPDGRFRPYAARSLRSPRLYRHYQALFDALLDPACAPLRLEDIAGAGGLSVSYLVRACAPA
jgi:hypothetical protein